MDSCPRAAQWPVECFGDIGCARTFFAHARDLRVFPDLPGPLCGLQYPSFYQTIDTSLRARQRTSERFCDLRAFASLATHCRDALIPFSGPTITLVHGRW